MNDPLSVVPQEKLIKRFFIFFSIPILFFIPLFIISENYKLLVVLVSLPLVAFMYIYFDKYFIYYFIASLFINFYFIHTARIQAINLVSYAIFVFFLLNKESALFNKFKLPKDVKIIATLLITSVIISSVFTQHVSRHSLYFGYLFITFITTSYIIFKSITRNDTIDKYLEFYILVNFICALIIIFEIFITSRIRGVGFSGYSYMGLVMNSFVIILFKYFILGKPNFKYLSMIMIMTITIVTNQSRFAWFGIVLCVIYGLIVCFKYEKETRKLLSNKIFIILFGIIAVTIILISTGFSNLLFSRISEISFTFFEPGEEEEFEVNSLETRIIIWSIAVNAFLQNPITGIGYQMFPLVSENYNIFPNLLFEWFVKDLDAHSTMINVFCELGIIGFPLFYLFIITIYRYSFKAIKMSQTHEDKTTSIILNILIFQIFTSSIYSGAYTFGQNAFEMHFIFALVLGNFLIIKRKINNKVIQA